MADQEKKSKTQEVLERMENGIKDVFESDRFKDYLTCMSKFHNYSFGNIILIKLQNPGASLVAGYQNWRTKFNRQVKKGETGITILAPNLYKQSIEKQKVDPATQKPVIDAQGNPVKETEEISTLKFRAVTVFDVSQTTGEPLPTLTTELDDEVLHYDLLLESFKSSSPLPVSFEKLPENIKGYCSASERRIVVKEGMSQAQNIKTLIHEITHAHLHMGPKNPILEPRDRQTEEVQAEATAFVVCDHFGIDTSQYSFAYLASWSSNKNLNELKNSLTLIQKQASELITNVEKRFAELRKAHELLLQNEALDGVRHDNDIDADRVRSRSQLGFRDDDKESIANRVAAAREAVPKQPQRGTNRQDIEKGDR